MEMRDTECWSCNSAVTGSLSGEKTQVTFRDGILLQTEAKEDWVGYD